MRTHHRIKEIFVSILACVFVASCLSASPLPSPEVKAKTLVFNTSLSSFIKEADSAQHDERLIWTTDGCSAPVVGSTGRSFDFYNACRRHDFAYRNFSRLNNGKLWTQKLRAQIDTVFKQDMTADCMRRKNPSRASCLSWAETFFTFVRAYGQ